MSEPHTFTVDLDQPVDALAKVRGLLLALETNLAEATSAIVVPTPPPPAPPSDKPRLVWGGKVSQKFRDSVFWIADQITQLQKAMFDPNWLMACMAWESGESFSPSKKNLAGSGATGLIQFMPTTATELAEWRSRKTGKTIKLTTEILAAMSAEEQLSWVYWYFVMMIERRGAITNLEDCYMAILWPSAIGEPVTAPLWTKAGRPTTFRQNAGLDTNKDGTITKLEAAGHVRAKMTEGLKYAA